MGIPEQLISFSYFACSNRVMRTARALPQMPNNATVLEVDVYISAYGACRNHGTYGLAEEELE